MSDVSIKVTGLGVRATGVSIVYGINSVPTAVIQIDPADSTIICNSEDMKRKPVGVRIKTKNGCITFNGVYDGLSVNQVNGSLSYGAVIKSTFQQLFEIYPKMPGLHPMGQGIFRRTPNLKYSPGSDIDSAFEGIQDVSVEGTFMAFYIRMIKNMLQRQKEGQIAQFISTTNLSPILDILLSDTYQKQVDTAIELINNVDISATDGTELKAGNFTLGESVANMVINNGSTLWGALTSSLSEMGCILLVSDKTMYIVPDNPFLLMKRSGVPSYRQKANKINVAFPADYNNVNFNDNGYIDIGHCFLMFTPDGQIMASDPSNAASGLGRYSDPKAKSGGVLVMPVNSFQHAALASGNFTSASKRVPYIAIPEGDNLTIDQQIILEDKRAKIRDARNKVESEVVKKLCNNWAELQYYRAKYGDRSGSLTVEFNPNWTPGTSGTIYSRIPGIYLDMYVRSVSHTVALNAPNGGTAITSVSFSSARIGNDPIGVDNDSFYNYNTEKMEGIQSSFVKDISKS